MKAVILAAGKGTRLAPLTDDRPKPLVEVGGRALLMRALDRLADVGVADGDVIVVGGYRDDALRRALAGRGVTVFGRLNSLHSFIYLDDFARGLVTLGAREEALGQIWHLPCAPTLTQEELLAIIYEEAGHQPRTSEMPGSVVRALGVFGPAMREIAELLYLWEEPFIFDFSKFEKAFPDAVAVTPHREAVRATLAWFRKNPKRMD